MIIEKALVQYDKNGNYDYTIQSDYYTIEEDKVKDFIIKNWSKNIEFYFYKNQNEVENCEHYNVIICNESKKEEYYE